MRATFLILLFVCYLLLWVVLEGCLLRFFNISCQNYYYSNYSLISKIFIKLIYAYGSLSGIIFYFILILITKKVSDLLYMYLWGFITIIILFIISYIIVDFVFGFDFFGRLISINIKSDNCEYLLFYFNNYIYPIIYLIIFAPLWYYKLGDWFWQRGKWAKNSLQ